MPTKYKYRFERWSGGPIKVGRFINIGTIRTVPQNYYVASVLKSGALRFEGIEAMTRQVNKDAVRRWWKEYRAKGGKR